MGCDKIKTQSQATPVAFAGISAIQNSSDSSLILTWKIPFTVLVENYEVYILPIKAEDAKALEVSTAR